MPDGAAAPVPAEIALLGLLQGPAELLPVSSSAHVEALAVLAGLRFRLLPGALRKEAEVALHAGTALALLAAAPRSAARPRPLLLGLTLLPPAVAALAFERAIEERLGTPRTMAAGLALGSCALLATAGIPPRRAEGAWGAADALALGCAQAAALVPGVSRSGAVIAAARARGFGPAAALSLSRQCALPVLLAAAGLKGVRLAQRRPEPAVLRALAAGLGAAAGSTALALRARGALARVPVAVWAVERIALAAVLLACEDRAP